MKSLIKHALSGVLVVRECASGDAQSLPVVGGVSVHVEFVDVVDIGQQWGEIR
ncbi:hypothetical protein CFELI_06465 [Corynebacterium felinum]|uniref:Uncharacterized protein n=1 Tax=Corynebacterium felinum TaxID=131318 RepID=A0ABU2BAD9_9CORY|nr:hypothetical protein [Corynebacterium felinum]WJY94910.1 hypothetical protein CFELI_06465 [Corynebacterium felinum]